MQSVRLHLSRRLQSGALPCPLLSVATSAVGLRPRDSHMAYIHDSNAPTANLRVPGMDRSIDIPESGIRQVRSDEADLLVEHCPTITHHTPNDE